MSTTGFVLLLLAAVAWVIVKSGVLKQPRSRKRTPTKAKAAASQPSTATHHWPALGNFEFEVVGESNYQKAIAAAAGSHGTQSADVQCLATLEPEDDNPYDPKAVAIRIQGTLVGYLSREDARSFRRRLGQKRISGQVTTCDALIVGGGTRKNGEKLHYGVKLDIKPFDA